MIDLMKRLAVGAAAAALLFTTACSNRTGDTATGGSGDVEDIESSSGSTLEPGATGSESDADMGGSTTGSGADMGGSGDVGSDEAGTGGAGDADDIQQQSDPNSWDSSTRTNLPARDEAGAGTGGAGPGEDSSSGSVLEEDADTEGDDSSEY